MSIITALKKKGLPVEVPKKVILTPEENREFERIIRPDRDVTTLLIEAKEILLTEGWIRGALHDRDGHCAVGAIEAAFARRTPYGNREVLHEAVTWVRRSAYGPVSVLAGGYNDRERVMNWNDAPHNGKVEVIRCFDRAITMSREQAA